MLKIQVSHHTHINLNTIDSDNMELIAKLLNLKDNL